MVRSELLRQMGISWKCFLLGFKKKTLTNTKTIKQTPKILSIQITFGPCIMPSQIDGLTSPGSFGFFHQPPPLTWRVTSEPLGGAAASVYFSHSLWNRIPPLEQKDLLTRQPHGKHHRGVIVHEWKLLSSLPPPHQHHQLPLNADTVIHKHHHTKVCWSCAVTQTLWLPLWIFFLPLKADF